MDRGKIAMDVIASAIGAKAHFDVWWTLTSEARLKSRAGEAWKANDVEAKRFSRSYRRLTSQWSGRLRAAHSGAAHRRVRHHETNKHDP